MNKTTILITFLAGFISSCSSQYGSDAAGEAYPYVSVGGAVISDEYAKFVGYVVGARYQHSQGNLDFAESLYENAIRVGLHEVPNYAVWGEYSYLLSVIPGKRDRSLDYYHAYRWAYRFLSGDASCVDAVFESPNVSEIVLGALCTEDVEGFVFGEKDVGWPVEKERMAKELEALGDFLDY